MNLEQTRVELAQEVIDAVGSFPDEVYPVDWQNDMSVDLAAQDGIYLTQEIVWGGADQRSLGLPAMVRLTGVLALLVNVKQGEGISVATRLRDHLMTSFSLKTIHKAPAKYSIIFSAARPLPAIQQDGWHRLPLQVPFFTHILQE